MRRITLIIATGIVASFIISCSNPKTEVTSEKTPEIHIIEPDVLAQIEALNDSVNHSWTALQILNA
jgi:hypothetical protein